MSAALERLQRAHQWEVAQPLRRDLCRLTYENLSFYEGEVGSLEYTLGGRVIVVMPRQACDKLYTDETHAGKKPLFDFLRYKAASQKACDLTLVATAALGLISLCFKKTRQFATLILLMGKLLYDEALSVANTTIKDDHHAMRWLRDLNLPQDSFIRTLLREMQSNYVIV